MGSNGTAASSNQRLEASESYFMADKMVKLLFPVNGHPQHKESSLPLALTGTLVGAFNWESRRENYSYNQTSTSEPGTTFAEYTGHIYTSWYIAIVARYSDVSLADRNRDTASSSL